MFQPSNFQNGQSEVVANDAGDRVTPAVVAFTDHDEVMYSLKVSAMYKIWITHSQSNLPMLILELM